MKTFVPVDIAPGGPAGNSVMHRIIRFLLRLIAQRPLWVRSV